MFSKACTPSQTATPRETSRPKVSARRATTAPRTTMKPMSSTRPSGSDEAELLPRHREDEVGLLEGDEAALGLAPGEEALPREAARADGDAHLPGLVADALRVERRVEEGLEPVALVGREQRRRESRDRDAATPSDDHADRPRPRRARRRDDDDRHRDEHERRAEVGLGEHEHDGYAGHDPREGDVTMPLAQSPICSLGQEHGEPDGERDLHQLGGLQGEAAGQPDPRPRAVDRRAQRARRRRRGR